MYIEGVSVVFVALVSQHSDGKKTTDAYIKHPELLGHPMFFYRNSQRASVRPSFCPSEKKVLSQPQFFTDPYQIWTACLYH